VVTEGKMRMPIFPLPRSILFPGIYAPFHIFEERYKTMLKKIEAESSILAVSYAPEVQPQKFYPHMICGAGSVRVVKRYDTGESDILVFGTHRIKFHSYVQEIPYLIGEGEVLQLDRDMPAKTEEDLLNQIKEMLIQWVFSHFEDSTRAIQFFKTIADLEPLCNFVGYYLVGDMEKKQDLLEENELQRKAQAVWQILKDMDVSGEGPKDPKGPTFLFPQGSSKKDFN